MYTFLIPRIWDIWQLIWLFRLHSFLFPLAKFEKIGIFGGKKLAQSFLCMLNTFKINKSNLSDFLERTGTSLRVPKEAWLSASECAVITCPQIGPSGFKLVLLGQIGLDLKLVRLWKTLGMAKLPVEENWSFQGLSEANLWVLEPRVFPPKLAKYGQGFPNLENDSHPTW